jgi:hypothetical protein
LRAVRGFRLRHPEARIGGSFDEERLFRVSCPEETEEERLWAGLPELCIPGERGIKEIQQIYVLLYKYFLEQKQDLTGIFSMLGDK